MADEGSSIGQIDLTYSDSEDEDGAAGKAESVDAREAEQRPRKSSRATKVTDRHVNYRQEGETYVKVTNHSTEAGAATSKPATAAAPRDSKAAAGKAKATAASKDSNDSKGAAGKEDADMHLHELTAALAAEEEKKRLQELKKHTASRQMEQAVLRLKLGTDGFQLNGRNLTLLKFDVSKVYDDSKVSASFLCQNEDCGVQVCAWDKALPSVMTKAEFEADVFAVGVFSSIAEVDWYKRVVG